MRYKYVQFEEHGEWKLVSTDKQDKNLEAAVRMTVLDLDREVTDDTPPEEVGYLGPLYFDIDCEGNLPLAIESTRDLVAKLKSLDVPEEGIEVYCSGSKGFHVFVPATVFNTSPGRAMKFLPYVYREMALELYVMGIDFQVYSAGRGRMFRPENGLRPDGKFRVRVTHDELDQMSPEMYEQLVQGKREVKLPGPNGHRATQLMAMFDRSIKKVKSKPKLRGSALPLEALQPYSEEPPGCIDLLQKYEIQKGVNFNQAALQFGAFAARSGMPDYKIDGIISMMAERADSSSYNSAQKRKIHLKGMVNYAKARPSLVFTCAAMRSCVGSSVCRACPLNQKDLTKSSEHDEDGAVLGILAMTDGYYMKREAGDQRLTTFTMHPVEVYLDYDQDGYEKRRVSTRMKVLSRDEELGTAHFNEMGWRSKAEFLKQLEGLPVSFFGSDTDVQRLKSAVYLHVEEDDVDEVINVYSAGIHATSFGDKTVFTYVEPNLSINSYGIQGTHRLVADITAAPELRKVQKPDAADAAIRDAIINLFHSNRPDIVAQMVGWYTAAHLKAHIHPMFRQFPILSLWGEAGSGKSMNAALFAHINGVDYRDKNSAFSVSTSTQWPIIEVCASTTTVPRLLDEFNQSQMRFRGGMYGFVIDVLKAAWDGMSVPRGTINKSRAGGESQTGAKVQRILVSAPIVVCSEQQPQKPALQQRSVQIQLSRMARRGCDDAYNAAVKSRRHLMRFGRALTMMALRTKPEWIEERYEANLGLVPGDLYERHRFSYQTLFVGLDFFAAVAASLNLELDDEIERLKQSLSEHLCSTSGELSAYRNQSEVDLFLTSLADMAQLAIQNSSLSPLVPGKNFMAVPSKDELILDLRVVFPMYRKHARQVEDNVVFSSLRQLEPLLKSEPYYVTDQRVVQGLGGPRKLWVLSLSKMREKGHDTNMWVSA